MRHRVKGRALSRKYEHRKSLLRNLTKDLIIHGKVDTTLAKAKEAQRYAERLINLAKEDNISTRRRAFQLLQDKEAVKRLFAEVAPKYQDRQGGYTRVVKLLPRRGDGAEMARLMLV